MSQITTHILDAATGQPASDVAVELTDADGTVVATGVTGDNGRITDFGPDSLAVGAYRLVFATAEYFARTERPTFYPRVTIDFSVTDAQQHYHVPLLISPFAYSTYRGN